ncbi:unnamed protein product [Symbiodinium sp. CCMP2592]|nr:unnamed protein product [Symbiodinium sp. CCMP2592]
MEPGRANTPIEGLADGPCPPCEAVELALPASRLLCSWGKGLLLPASAGDASNVLGDDYDNRLAFGEVPLHFTPRQLHALFRPRFHTLSFAECHARLPASQQNVLRRLVERSSDPLPFGLVCYTDGSYTPDGPHHGCTAGWSCVFINRGRFATCDSDRRESARHDLAFFPVAQVGGVASVLGHVSECCRATAVQPATITYTPGHAGILGNEIADVAAKSAAKGSPMGRLHWEQEDGVDWRAAQGENWSWASIVCRWAQGDDALPSPLGDEIRTGKHDGIGLRKKDLLSNPPGPLCLRLSLKPKVFTAPPSRRPASVESESVSSHGGEEQDHSVTSSTRALPSANFGPLLLSPISRKDLGLCSAAQWGSHQA